MPHAIDQFMLPPGTQLRPSEAKNRPSDPMTIAFSSVLYTRVRGWTRSSTTTPSVEDCAQRRATPGCTGRTIRRRGASQERSRERCRSPQKRAPARRDRAVRRTGRPATARDATGDGVKLLLPERDAEHDGERPVFDFRFIAGRGLVQVHEAPGVARVDHEHLDFH
jgi:hypothetical protein